MLRRSPGEPIKRSGNAFRDDFRPRKNPEELTMSPRRGEKRSGNAHGEARSSPEEPRRAQGNCVGDVAGPRVGDPGEFWEDWRSTRKISEERRKARNGPARARGCADLPICFW